jgi:hypothetical protein
MDLLHDTRLYTGTAFPEEVRAVLGLHGLPGRNQGRICAASHQMKAITTRVSALFSQVENRFSRAQRMKPICEEGGSTSGSISVRT